MSHPLPPKKEVALALLERSSVHVHLDPRGTGAVVPPWFKKQPQLVLQIGLNMPVPIPDLRLDDAGMSCTLSFNRSPFHCVVPWASVFAMVGDDGRGMVWPDEVPPEIAKQPAEAAPPPGPHAVPSSGASAGRKSSKRTPAPAVEGARASKEAKEEKPAKAKKASKKKRPAGAPGGERERAREDGATCGGIRHGDGAEEEGRSCGEGRPCEEGGGKRRGGSGKGRDRACPRRFHEQPSAAGDRIACAA